MQRTTIFLALFVALNLTAPAATTAVPKPNDVAKKLSLEIITAALANLSLDTSTAVVKPLRISLSCDESEFMLLYPYPEPESITATFDDDAQTICANLATNFAREVKEGQYLDPRFDHTKDNTSPKSYAVGRCNPKGYEGLHLAPRIIGGIAEPLVHFMKKTKKQFDFFAYRKHEKYHERHSIYRDHAVSMEAIVYGIMHGQPHTRWNKDTRTYDLCFILPCIMHYRNTRDPKLDTFQARWLKITFDCPTTRYQAERGYHVCLHDSGVTKSERPCNADATTDGYGDIIFKFGRQKYAP